MTKLRKITMSTLRWASEHSQILPSPQYPGGHPEDDRGIPEEWDFTGTGTGLWLDGVVFYAAYHQRADELREESGDEPGEVTSENGSHLKGTAFVSQQSFKKNPTERDWHRHSYAMNRSLQYSSVYSFSEQPELTNKSLARIAYRPSALLFTENESSNVVGYEDREMIIATAKKRWSSGKAISSFLDGSVRTLKASDIPSESRRSNLESCQFWSGVSPETFNCGTCRSSGELKADDLDEEVPEEAVPEVPLPVVAEPVGGESGTLPGDSTAPKPC